MPKRETIKKTSLAPQEKTSFQVNIRIPLRVTASDFKRLIPRSSSQVLVVLLVIAAFLIGVLFTKVQYLEKGGTANNQQAAAPAGTAQQAAPTPGARVKMAAGHFPLKGNANAKVSIVEFADFRCPFCEQFFTNTEPQLLKEFVDTGKANFAFRNFAFLGPASVVAANASECANDQGKFWDFYDYLYKNQPAETDTTMYTTDTLAQDAATLGMDSTAFTNCLNNKTDDAKAAKDLADGQAAGVSGTPSFFINGNPIVGACPIATLEGAVNAETAGKSWSVSNCALTVK
jgi:protein-disulfide isomerase